MPRLIAALAFALGLLFPSAAEAQGGKFNKKIKIGDPAPVFADLPGTDGKKHSLSDYKDKDVLVVCITCNSCPEAVAYEERIIDFTKKFTTAEKSKVAFLAVSVSHEEEDNLEQMKIRAKEKGFNFPYLSDLSQNLGRSLGASVTPEFFVFDKDRKLAYTGALDDSRNAKKASKRYLADAVQALLDGKSVPVAETLPVGCAVEYLRKKAK